MGRLLCVQGFICTYYHLTTIIFMINPFSAGTVFTRRNLTSVDFRFRCLKKVPALVDLKKYIMAVGP